ncbi:MAG: Mrp/NBP35 family ATP-binding protein [Candidatus Eremiobacteraeota bacterium]|nr:Mrp/NBP35 family ATP-binding protein [Candidatus Eremiobacteraeota bacterium]
MNNTELKENNPFYNPEIESRMENIKNIFLIFSGKGGVGKSTIAAKLASHLVLEGKQVGLLDVDIHGPSIPTLFGIADKKLETKKNNLEPIRVGENLKVISIGFLLQSENDAVIWRGPLKTQMIISFLRDVEWGNLDYLIIDLPPGTGDESLSICQFLNGRAEAVIITTPQDLSVKDVQKAITFCGQLHIPIAGIIENMSGFICPHCGENVDIFKTGGGEKLAAKSGVNFLGRIPIFPIIVEESDSGKIMESKTGEDEMAKIFKRLTTYEKGEGRNEK